MVERGSRVYVNSENVRQARYNLGLRQRDVASLSGLSTCTVNLLEARGYCSEDSFKRISSVLGVSEDVLLGREPVPVLGNSSISWVGQRRYPLLHDRKWLSSKVSEGLSLSQIASLVGGCSRERVRQVLYNLDVRRNPAVLGRKYVPVVSFEKLKNLRDDGLSVSEISRVLGCSLYRVKSAIKFYGLSPSVPRASRKNSGFTSLVRRNLQMIKMLRISGKSYVEIAKILDPTLSQYRARSRSCMISSILKSS